MEWDAPAIVLAARPYGEGDAVVTVLTAEHGATSGLARGAQSKSRAATWLAGNVVQARWVGRLESQLGSLTAEAVHAPAPLVMDDALLLGALTSVCAVTGGALPEREGHPRVFEGLLHVITRLARGPAVLADVIRWEALLLAELGYGLDLSACAVTGATDGLARVSPRTGRAVSDAGAGIWRDRLLPLPAFLLGDGDNAAPGDPPQWRDGLRLTGHFLARDVFGVQHKPLPAARIALYHRVTDLAEGDTADVG